MYTIAEYLLDRLAELDAGHVFGVPGDFTLGFLDHVVAHDRLEWVGCTNELNAGYAADGYARLRGIGVLTTTFGVGELSAVNAIAGSFAEHVPVVHVVGSPSTNSQAAQRMVHHSLGDGVFTHFMQMHEPVTCARASVTAENARAEIDRVLTAVRDQRLPGYLLLPCDVGEHPTDPPAAPLPPHSDPTDDAALSAFCTAASGLLAQAGDRRDVTVLAGLLVHRLTAGQSLRRLLDHEVPHATSAWAKSVVDESSPAFLGIYAGAASEPAVRAAVEDAGCLVIAGVQFTDLNSGFFTQQIPRERTIELGAEMASVGEKVFAPVRLGRALDVLADLVASLPRAAVDPPRPRADVPAHDPAEPLDQRALWAQVASFLAPGDVVLADQGTSFYGMATHRLPRDVTFVGQPLWASIGYTVPALLGAVLATGRRGVLLVGDGAAQMTATEISTLLRHELPAVIVVVDNDGYTVERAIHGAEQPYNDIGRWDWAALPAVLGVDRASTGCRAVTVGELEAALRTARLNDDRPSLIQAVVPQRDVPQLLADLARAAAAANAAAAQSDGTRRSGMPK